MDHAEDDSPGGGASHDTLIDALGQTAFTVMAVLTRVAAQNDISLTQLRLMGILRDRRVRMSGLAEFLGLEKSTLSGLVARAEKRDLLARVAGDGDGRAVDVVITPAGSALAERVFADVRRALEPTTSAIGADDRRALARLLGELLAGAPSP